jgi:hypothetical protein
MRARFRKRLSFFEEKKLKPVDLGALGRPSGNPGHLDERDPFLNDLAFVLELLLHERFGRLAFDCMNFL